MTRQELREELQKKGYTLDTELNLVSNEVEAFAVSPPDEKIFLGELDTIIDFPIDVFVQKKVFRSLG